MRKERKDNQEWGYNNEYPENNKDFNQEPPEEPVPEYEDDKIDVIFKDETYEHRPMQYFEDANLGPQIMQVIQQLNFQYPTKIQSHSLPLALSDFDVIGIAKTGSGKTLSFLLPGIVKLLDHIQYCREYGYKYNNREAPFILVLAPTRELALQIYNSALPFTNKLNLSASAVYGGTPMGQQIKSVRNIDLLIATPGRLLDLLGRQVLRLDHVGYFVLDEADRMLDMGFIPQVEEVMNHLTTERQNLLWSATWPKEVQKIANEICINEIAQIKIGSDDLTVNGDIQQIVEVVEDNQKLGRLFDFLKEHHSGVAKTLIFVKTKIWCERLSEILSSKGIQAMALHGGKSQTVDLF